MQSTIEEALRAKGNAEKLFAVKDFAGAKTYALEAQTLCHKLEGISQMVATFEIYYAAERKIDGEIDFYSILGLDPSADKSTLKKQYKKMAVLLHPDKNKTVGADGAFRLVSEAWTLLSDSIKRSSYDDRRSKQFSRGAEVTSFENCSNSLSFHNRVDSFWTVCTSCHVQYEYLRKYVNKKLSCKNCRGVFIAAETGTAPVSGSFPFNEHVTHGYNRVTYIPTTAVCFTGNGVQGIHSRHGSEFVPNTQQWSSFPGPSKSVNVVPQANGNVIAAKLNGNHQNGNHHNGNVVVNMGTDGHNGKSERRVTKKLGRPPKKSKVDVQGTTRNGSEEMGLKTDSEVKLSNGNGNIKQNHNIYSTAPAFDARKLLIDKARTIIRRKLEEKRWAPPFDHQLQLKKAVSISLTVPDSDFHDFDKDRMEECFQPKQIWALYDEEDGMPRLYCLIRQVISVKPFKVFISYLSSKTDTEFGSVNWLDSGFTKACGNFRAFNTDILDQVNVFSHLLSLQKAGRGGCVKIYPRSGDIWAVYRNWTSEWNKTTPENVRHQYEMVEILEDYSEELGVWVIPLIKLDGFKTVYQRNTNNNAIRWISKREMLRFSHQVPACVLKGNTTNLPDGCWDLDPAATPDELLQPIKMVNCAENPAENFRPEMEVEVEEKHSFQREDCPAISSEFLQDSDEMLVTKTPVEVLQDLSEMQVEKPRRIENFSATSID